MKYGFLCYGISLFRLLVLNLFENYITLHCSILLLRTHGLYGLEIGESLADRSLQL